MRSFYSFLRANAPALLVTALVLLVSGCISSMFEPPTRTEPSVSFLYEFTCLGGGGVIARLSGEVVKIENKVDGWCEFECPPTAVNGCYAVDSKDGSKTELCLAGSICGSGQLVADAFSPTRNVKVYKVVI